MVRILLVAIGWMLVGVAPAAATDWWGRKLPDQPTNFIVGYGSLINRASRNASAASPIEAIPIRVSAKLGYVRSWNARAPSGFTALGLRKARAGETGTINGVLYPAMGADMASFDARESGYVRVEVPGDMIEALAWQSLPRTGKIWIYVPVTAGGAPGEGLPLASPDYPLLQSYIDVVVEGGLEFGEEFAREIIETTADWNHFWLDDRILARRPWVYDRQSGHVDALLAKTEPAATYFKVRQFMERAPRNWPADRAREPAK